MLTQEQNDALTRTDPGMPGGRLLRSYWQPIALASELPSGGAPVPVDILGEELVLFRDQSGRLGLLDRHCCHRGTDLSFGRLEDGGLRCLYHGWLYDIDGTCLEQPAEPKNSTFKDKVHQTAYPVVERAGAFFAYLGEGEPPEFPNYDFFTYPSGHLHAAKVFVDCNYLQANEGNYDPAHVGFLHKTFEADRRPGLKFGYLHRIGVPENEEALIEPEETPHLETETTDFGMRIFQMRSGGVGRKYVRVTVFGMPNFSAIAGPQGGDGHIGIWHVPIDDYSHWRWHFAVRRDAPIDSSNRIIRSHQNGEYESEFRLKRKRANRYLQDRNTMNQNFTGMGPNFNTHDAFATESQGHIQNRTREHLATTDVALAAARRLMLKAVDDVKAGKTPQGVIRDAAAAHGHQLFLSFDVLADEAIANTDLVHIIAERTAVAAG